MINVGGSFIFYFFEWLCLGVETFKIYTYIPTNTYQFYTDDPFLQCVSRIFQESVILIKFTLFDRE